jgi:hypothetical protein
MESAPRDGTVIEVVHGARRSVARAYWAAQRQAFVRAEDEERRTLQQVTAWRPI